MNRKAASVVTGQLHQMDDDDLDRLRIDALDDFTWKSGSRYAKILSDLCESELAARQKGRAATGDDSLIEAIRKRRREAARKQRVIDGSG